MFQFGKEAASMERRQWKWVAFQRVARKQLTVNKKCSKDNNNNNLKVHRLQLRHSTHFNNKVDCSVAASAVGSVVEDEVDSAAYAAVVLAVC